MSSNNDEIDATISSLIRYVSRNFYGKSYVLVLDAILLHSVLSEEDLLYLLSFQKKELKALCTKLCEDRLLTMVSQKEVIQNQNSNYYNRSRGSTPGSTPNTPLNNSSANGNNATSSNANSSYGSYDRERSGQPSYQRYVTKIYYFIHHSEAIDSIKYKVNRIVNSLKDEMNTDSISQGYICPRCRQKVSQVDSVPLYDDNKGEFVCDVCGAYLIDDDSSKIATLKQQKLAKLQHQIDPIIILLKKIDDHWIPENDFNSALAKMIPAQSNSTAAYTVSTFNKYKNPNTTSNNNSSSSVNSNRSTITTLHVNITGDNEEEEKKQKEEIEIKRQKAILNALPAWHQSSTVGKTDLNITSNSTNNKANNSAQNNNTNNNNNKNANNNNNTNNNGNNYSSFNNDSSSTISNVLSAKTNITMNDNHNDSTPNTTTVSNNNANGSNDAQDLLTDFFTKLKQKERNDDDDDDNDDDSDEDDLAEFEDLL
ncbi:transcription factor TFIIE subunit TFA1 ASCRUDRAFT_75854 [Ascoidea rubescens DSM 1968]|uniref:HTH TFE/IIEalpha-type domain-containing protein n=1 Tax=Ascoidea rubescens DSM 1968 TaxID=1344418 RepID=A0A1D2VHQ8_9ASCO|nr:hypothetical protein ASCRUDRAFT_75854 [Ascoidea rubescens DSM 1968]ODV61132.1 hypothetical protein ASCRUDRAFT_75854 [Ascoidea rubescens DSM 1968]